MRNSAVAILAFLLLAGVGLAQEKKKLPPPPAGNAPGQPGVLHVRFGDVDATQDGRITKAELEAYFARLDTQTDGGINPAEFNAAAAAARGCAGAAAAPGAEPKKK